MTVRRIYIGTQGPYDYDDEEYIDDRDGYFSGKLRKAFITDGQVDSELSGEVEIIDTDASHTLHLRWNEDDTVDRILNFLVNAANRTIDLSGDLTVEDAAVIDQDLTQDASPTFDDMTLSNPNGILQLLSHVVCSDGEVVVDNGEVVWQS